ncbi:hypothetical protein ACZ87_00942 [Candidatus Erwinia dacicola]|uniref:Uncharacterized protein n=1 Tax=Candidatus Erwinia dacicola TaxID=252393 RepID=A0A328TRQ6_9GAMM|nr:hypothetical protein ACZ87_00942 [Candidatus Erwinia dacicola]
MCHLLTTFQGLICREIATGTTMGITEAKKTGLPKTGFLISALTQA